MDSTQSTSGVLTRKQAAEYLSISKGTLDKLDIPRIQIRRRAVYRKTDIDAWLETQKIVTDVTASNRREESKR